jgi:hypothetical protein
MLSAATPEGANKNWIWFIMMCRQLSEFLTDGTNEIRFPTTSSPINVEEKLRWLLTFIAKNFRVCIHVCFQPIGTPFSNFPVFHIPCQRLNIQY